MRHLSYTLFFAPLVLSAEPISSSNEEPRASPSGALLENAAQPAAEESPKPGFDAGSLAATPSLYGASAPSGTASLGAAGLGGSPAGGTREPFMTSPFSWGPFTAHPHLSYGFTYATGVLAQPGAPSETALHTLSPGMAITSRHLTLDYTPSLNYYSKGPYEDSLDHNANLAAEFGYNDWKFGIFQSYALSSQPLIETGTQTKTESFTTGLTASWLFNEKIFFDFSLSQQIQSSQGFQSSRNWSTMNWLNYRLTQHLSVGSGVGGGYTEVDVGSDSTFEQFQGRLNWNPGRRLSVNLNGGVEVRQLLDSPASPNPNSPGSSSDNLINPLMGVGINYLLFDATSLFLAANRSVGSSLFTNELTENTSVSGGVSQRFLGRLNVGVSAGYRSTDYKNIGTAATNNRFLNVDRSDSSTFVSISFGTSFLRRGSISFSYQHSKNDSSAAGYTYDSDQFTASLGYRF